MGEIDQTSDYPLKTLTRASIWAFFLWEDFLHEIIFQMMIEVKNAEDGKLKKLKIIPPLK